MNSGVSLVIPVWNRADLLQKLLDSISLQASEPEEVIVVDNGSTDNAVQVAEHWGARIIGMGSNRGFAAAANCGIAACSTKWIGLINSDVELHAEWLSSLLLAAEDTGAWFATGKIFSALDPRRLDGTWDLIARSGCPWRAGAGQPDSARFATRQYVALTSATAVLYRRDLFARVGKFSELYGSYLEDVDFGLRCAAAKLAGVYEPAAVCHHHGSASGGVWSHRTTYLLARNQSLLVRRLFPPGLRRRWRWNILVGQILWGLVAFRHGQFGAWLCGKQDARRLLVEPVPGLDGLEEIIRNSENEIYRMQRGAVRDLYWRLYFYLTGGGSE